MKTFNSGIYSDVLQILTPIGCVNVVTFGSTPAPSRNPPEFLMFDNIKSSSGIFTFEDTEYCIVLF